MLYLTYKEVYFKRRLGFRSLQVWHYNIRKYFAKMIDFL